MTDKKNVAIVFGGASSEHSISLLSAYSVLNNISYEQFNVVKVGITQKGIWFVYNGENEKIKDGTWEADTENLTPAVISPCTVQHGLFLFNKQKKTFDSLYIDVVFPLIHGKTGEDGALQGLFTLAGIPFVGCGILSSACCMDKSVAKELCEKEGIRVVDWLSAYEDEFNIEFIEKCEREILYPMFVKPASEGSSFGTSIARNREELEKAANLAFYHGGKILVEKYIDGREIEVAALDEDNIFISDPGEIVTDNGFYDFETKYVNNKAKLHIPADIDERTSFELKEIAKKIFRTLYCKGFGRIDFFVKDGEIYFNEINTLPGFTHISMYPKLMENNGVSYTELITKLINTASL